ncbi:hypothetical protein MKW94_026061 [Papaver nudicaule]|uniref:F-box domain-containing protein n=1 Tax=Papaver nudicaule TaxID=74823 RepID=A0AA41S6T2_PAPNU|nr:hypothetical protein [Papaver nudicaule]
MEEGSKGDLFLVDDLLIQILVWLPVISLLRFKTVCKSWRSIIQSSDFIHRHATFNNDDNKTGTLIFQSSHCIKEMGKDMGRFYVPHFFVLSSCSSNGWLYKYLGVPPYPRGEPLARFELSGQVLERHRPVTMVASCHGIICMHDIFPRDIALWNPATKHFRVLPKSLPLPEVFGKLQEDYVGFGFDTETKDYKVLLITYDATKMKNAVQVYSMRTNSWRWCVDVDLPATRCFSRDVHNQGVYLNGHYLFIATKFYTTFEEGESHNCSETVVISFDFSKESYTIIPAPTDDVRLDVRGRDGKIVCFTYLLPDDRKCQVYALNNDTLQNEDSWTKLYETGMDQSHSCLGPMAISKDGLCGFLRGSDGYGLMSYNLETEERKDIRLANVSYRDVVVQRAQIYKESLVSVYPPS